MQRFYVTLLSSFFLCLLCSLSVSRSWSALPPGDHVMAFKSTVDGSSQPYRLFIPEGLSETSATPFLLVLHGKGVNQDAWFNFTPIKTKAQQYGYIAAAPFARGDLFYRGKGEQDVLDIIADVKKICAVDQDRIYLMGHSMGGWGAWYLGLRHPDLFGTIVPMAPFVPFQTLANARNLSPLFIHSNDDPIVPVEQSRRSAEILRDLGITFEYLEEQGYGHASKIIGDHLDVAFDWLAKHPRVKCPTYIQHTTRTPKAGRAYWINVLAIAEFPKQATIEATLEDSSTISMKATNVQRFSISLETLKRNSKNPSSILFDDRTWPLKATSKWVEFSLNARQKEWDMKQSRKEPQPNSSRQVTKIPQTIVASDAPGLLSKSIASLIRKETGVDACILTDDMFPREIPKGRLTEDDVLDFFLYGVDRLAILTVDETAFQTILKTEATLGCGWWGKLYSDRELSFANSTETRRIVTPLTVAQHFSQSPEILPGCFCEYLLRGLKDYQTAFP